jgi:hypothetical protein
MPLAQINFFLYKTEAGKNRVWNRQERGRGRNREADKGSRRQSIGENRKQRGLRKVTVGKDT